MFAVTLAEIVWRIFYALFAVAAAPPSLPLPISPLCRSHLRRRVDEILERSIALRKMKNHSAAATAWKQFRRLPAAPSEHQSEIVCI